MSRTQDLPARFEIERDEVPFFILLFQYGVRIRCTTGVSIEGLLVTGLGIARAYLEKRLGTVFLDGSPVDDIGETFIMSDMTLALSSAMPGLAGPTLRRKGILSPLRMSIMHRDADQRPRAAQDGCITVKLFNVLAEEIGPVLVKRGVRVEAAKLAGFIRSSPQKARIESIMSKNMAGAPEDLVETLDRWGTEKIEIKARS